MPVTMPEGRVSHEEKRPPGAAKGGPKMLKWILILLIFEFVKDMVKLLIVAAVAGLLGMNSLAGAAMTGAKLLIAVVLILFLLAVLGIVVIA